MEKRKKGNRGGSRPGAGQPKTDDPRITIRIGVKQSKIKQVGGEQMIKNICAEAIDSFIPI